jgi:protein tyrosine phosphatase (PTP) superfamily phosphohydrolase (DUF442 family)
MTDIAARLGRSWRRMARKSRNYVVANAPAWVRRTVGRPITYLDMVVVDHGVFRLFYLNRHRLSEGAWRSAQPAPHHFRRFAREGIRTIVNLRGAHPSGSFWLEQRACARYGLKLVNFKISSRSPPQPEEIKAARALFDRVEYPILMHCKSGADRAGLMSVFYRIFREGAPVEEARKQLSIRYGHIRQADTGILDYFFDRYLADNARQPMAFVDWIEAVYDPKELKRSFHAKGWANRVVNGILRRE